MKDKAKTYTPSGKAFLRLTWATFRLNRRILAAGEALIKEIGVSAAGWQVLAAIYEKPLTVPQVARRMGLTRQSVQRTANILAKAGLVEFRNNPDHQRAKLVQLTEYGQETNKRIMDIYFDWTNEISSVIGETDLTVARQVMQHLIKELENY
ncbi:MAG: MarR family transcriptional regulator [Pseudomonadota bacterium]